MVIKRVVLGLAAIAAVFCPLPCPRETKSLKLRDPSKLARLVLRKRHKRAPSARSSAVRFRSFFPAVHRRIPGAFHRSIAMHSRELTLTDA